MDQQPARGAERERSAPRELYFSDLSFSLHQLGSHAHQLHHIWHMRPRSVIEVGLGNGFVSTFLKRAGLPVTTVDLNPALDPDICAPLDQLGSHLDVRADLVVCCEVLEHMPLSELDSNLDSLKAAGDRLFLTLPNGYRSFGLGGIANIPKLGPRKVDLNFNTGWRRRLDKGPHFWEVGSTRECSRRALLKRLRRRYSDVTTGRFALNPYHVYFECE